MERKPIAPLNTAAPPPATNVRGWNQRIARYEAAPPGASILGMDTRFDIHHLPHMDQRPPVYPADAHEVHEDAFEDQRDLTRSYTEAVQCLVECESIIGTLTERLASKDEHIAHLESKLVEISFELASLKAFADEHRSIRRSSFSSGGNDTVTTLSCSDHPNAVDICVGDNTTSLWKVTSSRRHSLPPARQDTYRQERSRWSRLEPMTWEGSLRMDDMSSDKLDKSRASFRALSTNISQFFRKMRDDTSMDQVARRPPNKKRVDRQAEQQTSITSFEGVVFPSSDASVIRKGCQIQE